MSNITKIDVVNALSSEASARAFENVVAETFEVWLADGQLSEQQKDELDELETLTRQIISTEVFPYKSDLESIAEAKPGFPGVIAIYTHIFAFVLMREYVSEPKFACSPKFSEIANMQSTLDLLEVLATHFPSALEPFPPIMVAGLISEITEADPRGQEALRNFFRTVQESSPEYATSIDRNLGVIEEEKTNLQPAEKAPALASMANVVRATESSDRKSFKKFFSKLPVEFGDQGYISNLWVSDYDSKPWALLFGDRFLAICNAKKQPIIIPSNEVRSVSVGTMSQRIHSGHSFDDFDYWTLDISRISGAQWRLRTVIAMNQGDATPKIDMLTRELKKVGEYYPVSSSGQHSSQQSGYRLTTSFGFRY